MDMKKIEIFGSVFFANLNLWLPLFKNPRDLSELHNL